MYVKRVSFRYILEWEALGAFINTLVAIGPGAGDFFHVAVLGPGYAQLGGILLYLLSTGSQLGMRGEKAMHICMHVNIHAPLDILRYHMYQSLLGYVVSVQLLYGHWVYILTILSILPKYIPLFYLHYRCHRYLSSLPWTYTCEC